MPVRDQYAEPKGPTPNVTAARRLHYRKRAADYAHADIPFVFIDGHSPTDPTTRGELLPMAFTENHRASWLATCIRRDEWVTCDTTRDTIPPCLAASTNRRIENCPDKAFYACARATLPPKSRNKFPWNQMGR